MRLLRDSLSEFLGTLFLTFLCIMGVYYFRSFMNNTVLVYLSPFILGAALMVAYYCFGQKGGGYFNPGTSFAALLTRKLGIVEWLVFMASEFVGALLGAFIALGAIMLMTGDGEIVYPVEAVTSSVSGIGYLYYFLLIAFVTMAFYFFYLQVISKKENNGVAGLILGLGLGIFSLSIRHFASGNLPPTLNPFLSLASGIAGLQAGTDSMSTIWIYVLAPFLGASFGAGIFVLWNHNMNPLRDIRVERKKQ